MTEPSSVFLLGNELKSNGGLSILPSSGTSISAISTGSSSGITSSLLNISAWDRTQPNVLLNNAFQTGDATSWVNSGCTIIVGDLPGYAYMCNCSNLQSISQSVTGFTNKNVVVTFWAKGNPLIISVESDDNSDVLTSSENRIIPQSDIWIKYTAGLYSQGTGGTKGKITVSSIWDNSYITNIKMYALDNFVQVSIGDSYNDYRDVFAIRGRKLFIGDNSQLISTRSETLDIRGSGFFSGDVNINGTLNTNILYPQPGLQSFSTNIIFSSGSPSSLSWTSGLVNLLSTVSYGVSSGSATISGLVYVYLDLNISSSVLQTSSLYSDAISNQKIFLGTAQSQSVGNISFTSRSGQTPIVSGQQLTPSSVTFDKITVNSLSALTANMGTLTAGIITLGGAGSYLNFGVNPPVSSTGTIGLSGLFQDYTGLFSLSGTTLNASLTSDGLSAGSSNFIADVNGISLIIPTVLVPSKKTYVKYIFASGGDPVSGLYSYWDASGRSVNLFLFSGFDPETGNHQGRVANIQVNSFNGTVLGTYGPTSVLLQSGHDNSPFATLGVVTNSNTTSGTITLNSQGFNVDTDILDSSGNHNLFSQASTSNVGIGLNTPSSKLHIYQSTLGNEIFRIESLSTNDDPRESIYQNRVTTTDATVTTIHTVNIPSSTIVAIEAEIIGRRTGGAAGSAEDSAHYKLSGCFKNAAGVATSIGTVANLVSQESQAAFSSAITGSGSDAIITVTGAVSNNIVWHVTIRTWIVST